MIAGEAGSPFGVQALDITWTRISIDFVISSSPVFLGCEL